MSPQDEKPPPRCRVRRDYPELVTREAADYDEEVFGEAWALVAEWRELKDAHPVEGGGLAWLTDQQRLPTLGLELLEDHGMTLGRLRK